MSEGSRADGVDDGGDGGGTPEVGSGPGPAPDEGTQPLLEQDQNLATFDQRAAAAAAGDNPGAETEPELDPDREGYDADLPDGSDYSQ